MRDATVMCKERQYIDRLCEVGLNNYLVMSQIGLFNVETSCRISHHHLLVDIALLSQLLIRFSDWEQYKVSVILSSLSRGQSGDHQVQTSKVLVFETNRAWGVLSQTCWWSSVFHGVRTGSCLVGKHTSVSTIR